MKFANFQGDKIEATPGSKGMCIYCKSEMITKCGEVKIWHWAHKGKRHCDPWWENETEWHRNWKDQFSKEWQEVIHHAEDGEKHIADVKTDQEWIIEFQHSYLKPEERRARSAFYPKLMWIVDGTRRKYDLKQFLESLEHGDSLRTNPPIQTAFTSFSKLLKDWSGLGSVVFFDFGESEEHKDDLWCLLPIKDDMYSHLVQFSRYQFIKLQCSGFDQAGQDFSQFFDWANKIISNEYARSKQAMLNSIQRYGYGIARRRFARSRRRF
jgi:competence protein CoiA